MATAPIDMTPPSGGEISFQDGSGIRYVVTDPITGDKLERTCVSFDVARHVQAIDDRVSRLLNFRHARFPRVRSVDVNRLTDGATVAWVVAEPVAGVRLIDLLRLSEQSRLSIDVNAALQLAREVLPALATLHDSRDVTHGAIGPERLVLTPQARVMIVDHVLRRRAGQAAVSARPPLAGIPGGGAALGGRDTVRPARRRRHGRADGARAAGRAPPHAQRVPGPPP